MSIVLDRITELIEPSLRQCGVELVDAQWAGTGGRGVLRLFIDRDGGVTLDDCERVSMAVGAVLDAYDPIAGAYQLEVSSPGAERPLRRHRDWQRALGRRINVRYRDGDAEAVAEGRLLQLSEQAAELEIRSGRQLGSTTVSLDDVVAAHVVAEIGR